MAPKRSRRGRGGGESTAPPRRSTRHRHNATFAPVTDNPERILRAARSSRRGGGRGGAGGERGGHRETGGLRMQGASGTGSNETEDVPPTSAPSESAPPPPTTSSGPSREPSQHYDPPAEGDAPTETEDGVSGSLDSVPDTTTRETEKGGEGNEKTGGGSQRGGEGEKSPGKRPSEDGEEGGKDPKRPRTEDEEESGSTTDTPDPDAPNPCDAFLNSMRTIGYPSSPELAQLEEPVRERENLELTTLFRAIAAVTEAITANNGIAFTLVDPNHTGTTTAQTVARPGHDVLFPYALGGPSTDAVRTRGGHLALFIYRTAAEGDRSFAVDNYDSSARERDPSDDRVREAYYETRWRLLDNRWLPNPAFGLNNAPDSPNRRLAPVQQRDWVCGLHVIFSAWTYALGLTPSSHAATDNVFFYLRGVELVNLAMLGRVDAQTIRNFLACYGFIQRDSQVPRNRDFASTQPFRTNQNLTQHIARIGLEDDLTGLRAEDPATPNLDTALTVIREAGIELPDNALVNLGASDIVERYNQAQRITIDGVAPAPLTDGVEASREHETSLTAPQGPATAIPGETGPLGTDRTSNETQRSETGEERARLASDQRVNELRGTPAQRDPLEAVRGAYRRGLDLLVASPYGPAERRNWARDELERLAQRERSREDTTGRDGPSTRAIDIEPGSERLPTAPSHPPPANELPESTHVAGRLLSLFSSLPGLPNEDEVREHYRELGTLDSAGAPASGPDGPQTPPPDDTPAVGTYVSPPDPSRPSSAVHLGGLPSTTAPLPGLIFAPRGEEHADGSGDREESAGVTSTHDDPESSVVYPPPLRPTEGPAGDGEIGPRDVPSGERIDHVMPTSETRGTDGGDSLLDYEHYERLEAERLESERREAEQREVERLAGSGGVDDASDEDSAEGDDDLDRSLFGDDYGDDM